MTLYNTIPTNTEDETLLKQSKTSLKGIVAGAAVTSFILGIVVATAMSPTYTPKQTSLTSTSCDTTSQASCLTIYGCQWFNDNGDVSGDVGGCRNWGDNFGQLSWWCDLAKDETSCTGQSVTFGNKNAYMTGTCSWDGSQCVVNKKWCPPMAKEVTCETDCGVTSGLCETACAATAIFEPECGIACGVVEGLCEAACTLGPGCTAGGSDVVAADAAGVAPVAFDSTKFCADWRQAYDEKCQAANVTCKAVPDDYCPVAN